MKKVLSLVMCVALFASMFTMLGVVAGAAAADAFDVVRSDVEDGIVTFDVYLKANVPVNGVILSAEFDPDVLQPVEEQLNDEDCAFYVTDSYGDKVQAISGMYAFGFCDGRKDAVSLAYVSINPYVSTSKKGLFSVSFRVVDENSPRTSVEFSCVELNSGDDEWNVPHNEANPETVKKHSFLTLGKVEITSVGSLEKGLRVSWSKVTGADEYQVQKYVSGSWKTLGTTTKTYYDDTTVASRGNGTYRVRAINDAGEAPFSTSVNGTHILSPKTVELTTLKTGVKVSWTKTTSADKYRVYRREIKANGTKSGWTFLANVASSKNYYNDTKASSGKHYEYTVRAVEDNKLSAICVFDTIWYYKAPTFTVKSAPGGVSVSWNAVSGAETYAVYRRYDGKGSWTRIATVKSKVKTYLDKKATSGRNIQYAVRVFGEEGSSKYNTKTLNYVGTPVLKTIGNSVSGVKITWGSVRGATAYRVYRKAGSGKYWQQVATVKSTSYVDKNVKSGVNYRYTVRAVKGSTLSGYESDGIVIKFLAAPKLTKAVNVSAGIKVTFGKVSGATSYKVYRKVGSGSWKLMGTTKNAYYTDKNVKNGTTYRYTVRAVYSKTLSGFYSSGVSVKCK